MAANHLRLYMDRDRATAPQFKLRTGGGTKKGEELTEDARANLLIEMGACRGNRHEEQFVCTHYTVHLESGRKMLRLWRERATARTATRRGRTSIMDSPGHLKGLREVNRDKNRRVMRTTTYSNFKLNLTAAVSPSLAAT